MGYSTKLHNATPFPVIWHVGPNIFISIDGDGALDMTPAMSDVFAPNTANYESILELMHAYGVFTLDPDVDFDQQMLTCLRGWMKCRTQQVDEAKKSIEANRARVGLPNDDASVHEALKRLNYGPIFEQMDVISKRIDKLQGKLKAEDYRPGVESYDPKRTIFVMDKPKQFKTEFQMELFLDENPEVKAKHEAWLAAQKPKKVKANEPAVQP